MSDYEGHRGTMYPTELTVREALTQEGYVDIPSYLDPEDEDDWEEFFRDTFYRGKYALVDGIVYRLEDERYEDCERLHGKLNPDGSISYDIYYYNGACGFDEALGYAIKNAKGE